MKILTLLVSLLNTALLVLLLSSNTAYHGLFESMLCDLLNQTAGPGEIVCHSRDFDE